MQINIHIIIKLKTKIVTKITIDRIINYKLYIGTYGKNGLA